MFPASFKPLSLSLERERENTQCFTRIIIVACLLQLLRSLYNRLARQATIIILIKHCVFSLIHTYIHAAFLKKEGIVTYGDFLYSFVNSEFLFFF